jgi:aconitase B
LPTVRVPIPAAFPAPSVPVGATTTGPLTLPMPASVPFVTRVVPV